MKRSQEDYEALLVSIVLNSFTDPLSFFKYIDVAAPCNRKHLPDGTPSLPHVFFAGSHRPVSSPSHNTNPYMEGPISEESQNGEIMNKDKISEDMTIKEVIDKYPETAMVFMQYNIGCIGCLAASFEKVKDIATVHGIDIKALVKDLNMAVQNK
jgi:hybrid cluster-associated redox disulfide protein